MNPFTTTRTPETLATEIVERANERLRAMGYWTQFGRDESYAPRLHALVQVVAEEVLTLHMRLDRVEDILRRAEARHP